MSHMTEGSVNPPLMSGSETSPDIVPGRAVLAGFLMLALVILATAWLRGSEPDVSGPVVQPLTERALHFVDLPGGDIAVRDAATGRTLEVLTGEQGFVRGTLRGVLRERKLSQLKTEEPLTLTQHQDGALVLADPATGVRLDLRAYGSQNAGLYARWLSPQTIQTR
jgi:putative photosynthetic complex assembly protein